jgi:hypothetical protein
MYKDYLKKNKTESNLKKLIDLDHCALLKEFHLE